MGRLSKKKMIEYLKGHYRYYVWHSWNRSSSYAHNVKVYRWVPTEFLGKAYEMLEVEAPYDDIHEEFVEFARRYDWKYQIWFNGRSGGYVVLGQGGLNQDGTVFISPGLGLDDNENFEDWDYQSLVERYKLVKDFDSTVEKAKGIFLYYCKNFRVVEAEEAVMRKYKTIEPIDGEGRDENGG